MEKLLKEILLNYLVCSIITIICFLICFYILNTDIIISIIISLCSFLVTKYIKYPVKYIYDYINYIKLKRYNYKQLYNDNKQKLDKLYEIVQCIFFGLPDEYKNVIIENLKYANKFLPDNAVIFNYPFFNENNSDITGELNISDLVYYFKLIKEHSNYVLYVDPLLRFYLITKQKSLRKKDYNKLIDIVKDSKIYNFYYKD